MNQGGRQVGLLPAGVGFYGLLGAVVVVVGAFLPWLTTGGRSLSAWDIPLLAIIPGAPAQGVPIAVVLLLPVSLLLPYLIRRALPSILRILLAAVTVNAAGSIVVIAIRNRPSTAVGLGVMLTLAGAVLMVLGEAGFGRRDQV
ncbi:MAG TPA: hypothetical protein VG329_08885 [Candidatus Dormibacteraeota bacterium]|jgi:hypothetical protein|nr:hypothetical protein [Candidatus Dormibacteraeota bacterium]